MKALALTLALALTACAGSQPVAKQPASPAVEAAIVKACLNSGMFKLVDGLLASALPAAVLPISFLNAGVDKVCADPNRFAADISTVEWVVKNTLDAAKR